MNGASFRTDGGLSAQTTQSFQNNPPTLEESHIGTVAIIALMNVPLYYGVKYAVAHFEKLQSEKFEPTAEPKTKDSNRLKKEAIIGTAVLSTNLFFAVITKVPLSATNMGIFALATGLVLVIRNYPKETQPAVNRDKSEVTEQLDVEKFSTPKKTPMRHEKRQVTTPVKPTPKKPQTTPLKPRVVDFEEPKQEEQKPEEAPGSAQKRLEEFKARNTKKKVRK